MIADIDVERFIVAQENIYPQIIKQLQAGKKTTHWMWFIFPQVDGLGFSATSKYYAIKSIKEAEEYLEHPVLGQRLSECANILLQIKNKSADEIFGYPDNAKLQSSMTVFDFVSKEENVFADVLKQYFNNKKDKKTLHILQMFESN